MNEINMVIRRKIKNLLDENIRKLLRKNKISLSLDITYIDKHQEKSLSVNSFIICDFNNLVWCNAFMWTDASSYKFYNIPIGYLTNIKQIKNIIKKWKYVFYEYFKYNYNFFKYHYEITKSNFYEISYGLEEKNIDKVDILKSKYLYNIIKNQWFSDQFYEKVKIDSQLMTKLSELKKDYDPYLIESSLGRFRIDESCPTLGAFYIRPPYEYGDLKHIKTNCLNIYKCLEDYNELYSINYKLPPEIRLYVKISNQLDEANTKYYEKYPNKRCDDKFEGFEIDIDPPEIFNQKVKDIVKDIVKDDSMNGIRVHSGYISMLKLHDIIWYLNHKD
jgi:hypothetical protein